jgi:molybdate transport system regulatory protein
MSKRYVIYSTVAIRNGKYNPKEHGFCRGIAQLLTGVIKLGSLNAGAKAIGMAYSKAWRITKEAEAEFGFKFINRDGARGSTITVKGKKLLRQFLAAESNAAAAANQAFFS